MLSLWWTSLHGSLNVPIEHHPTIRYMVYNGYYKVMSNIPKMGQLPTPGLDHAGQPFGKTIQWNAICQVRLGAKSWYWYLRSFLTEKMSFKWCKEQPCLAKNSQYCIMVHVDDILYCGDRAYWQQIFCSSLQRFTNQPFRTQGIGSEISFLKRKICRTERNLALLPGYKCWKGGWALWAVLWENEASGHSMWLKHSGWGQICFHGERVE